MVIGAKVGRRWSSGSDPGGSGPRTGAGTTGVNGSGAGLDGLLDFLLRRVEAGLGLGLAGDDIGGGLTIPYKPDDQPFDLALWAEGLAEIKAAWPRYRLAIEPGRYMVAECGVLLTHVTQVVGKQGVRRVGLDAGMNALMRPAMYDAFHAVCNLSRFDDAEDATFDIVGPICESSDVLGVDRWLPTATSEGDVVLVSDAGAYGFVMANTYNLRELPQEDVLE